MIEFIKTSPIPVLIIIYLLLGLLWKDFLILIKNKSKTDIEFPSSSQALTVVIWPISILIFVYAVAAALIMFLIKKRNER